ncbi:hypothetical protein P154DRAFT_624203 [Amniculicola lignicola CBS 123094]|uniref:C2H2-type domain-containing protein n=1 Tax=Amniculicola lignicola CBS 123094 TaxID=1392246 RepID=A0A6A5W1Y5_9PLEO|nr:hypothetical protein P154DRAFT_624203 [Amniculicola lignicola CBS 123094]
MSDYVPIGMQDGMQAGFQLDPMEDMDTVDWSALREEVMQEPWPEWDKFDWDTGASRAAEAVPGIGNDALFLPGPHISVRAPDLALLDAIPPMPTLETPMRPIQSEHRCSHEGCKSKSFGRIYELNRHMKKHQQDGSQRKYDCPAVGCPRTGKLGFYRLDKLQDHLLRGHQDDSDIKCPGDENHDCPTKSVLMRDIMALHATKHTGDSGYRNSGSDALWNIKYYRACPIPKCPYRIGIWSDTLDALEDLRCHITIKHSANGRSECSGQLAERGFDALTGDILCPICSGNFRNHPEFYLHLVSDHLQAPRIQHEAEVPEQEDLRPYRRTLLSLWPNFEHYPIWDDIKG